MRHVGGTRQRDRIYPRKASYLSPVLFALLMHLSAPAFAQTTTNEVTAGESSKEGEGAPPAAAITEPSWPLQKTIGVTVMALGGASIATGIAMGVVAGFKYADLAERGCTERECPDSVVSTGDLSSARTFVGVSAGTLIGGVTAWTAGIILLATSAHPSAFGARVTPVLGFNQIGVNIKF